MQTILILAQMVGQVRMSLEPVPPYRYDDQVKLYVYNVLPNLEWDEYFVYSKK